MGPTDSPEFLNKRKIACSVLGLNLVLIVRRQHCDGFLTFDDCLKFISYVTENCPFQKRVVGYCYSGV
jgi:hypothetical protein